MAPDAPVAGQVMTWDGQRWVPATPAGGGGGTTILNGAGPPTTATGAVGNYYEDRAAQILYGPKASTGAEQRPTVPGTPDSAIGWELGNKYTFSMSGYIVRIRYQRQATSASTLTFNIWNNDAGNALVATVSDTRAGQAGPFEVVLPVPVAVPSGGVRTLSCGSTNTPYNSINQTITNSANVTLVTDRMYISTPGSYPGNTGGFTNYVEPIFVDGIPWPVSVAQVPVSDSSTVDLTAGAGGITADVRQQMSITSDTAGLKLSGDVATPANGQFYGRASGAKGWFTVAGRIPGGRLTLSSTLPVTSADTSGSTLYYLPAVHNQIELWNGTSWQPATFDGTVSMAISGLTALLPYDVFAYLTGTVITLERLAWTNATTRATTLTLQDGRWCKTGDKTRLYLGTVAGSDATTLQDTKLQRFVWNLYNREPRPFRADWSGQWTYALQTWREHNATAHRVGILLGQAAVVEAQNMLYIASGAGGGGCIGLALDQAGPTFTPAGHYSEVFNINAQSTATIADRLAEGYHEIIGVEVCRFSATSTFYGSLASGGAQGGIMGSFLG
jgi:hypothetical protein